MEIDINDRVEYAAKVVTFSPDGNDKIEMRRHCVGYVKRIYRKWFTAYVEICECRTRRVDSVRMRDIFGKIDKNTYKRNKSKSTDNGDI